MERYVKVDEILYYESELKLMNIKQLEDLIKRCQVGIDEIERKRQDYINNNYENPDIEHYEDVLKRFESASVFLQADIILITNIIKAKKHMMNAGNEIDWLRAFYNIVCEKSPMAKSYIKHTDKEVGFSL